MPSPQTRPTLLMARNTVPSVMLAAVVHASMVSLTHVGMGTVRTCPPLPTRIGDDPVLLALLDPPELQGQQLAPPKPTAEEHGEDRVIAELARRCRCAQHQQASPLLRREPIAEANAEPSHALHPTSRHGGSR